mgnify:CR=1 FL=1|jgi:glutaredoxin
MRTLAALIITALILIPITSSASDIVTMPSGWDKARGELNAGSIGGISLSLSNDSLLDNISVNIENFPTIVETYTATWCENCVSTEHARDEAIADYNVSIIHYHRHYYETEDPFGSNSTESRWESNYGATSAAITGLKRAAPTTVFDGERMHVGASPRSDSMKNDFIYSLNVQSSAPLLGSILLSMKPLQSNISNYSNIEFSWQTSQLTNSCMSNCPNTISIFPWLLFVEEVAYYPEGSNDLEYYNHILHEAISLGMTDGSMVIDIPIAWDGDDMTAILLVDWIEEEVNNSLPAANILLTLMTFLVSSVVYVKKN